MKKRKEETIRGTVLTSGRKNKNGAIDMMIIIMIFMLRFIVALGIF